MKKTITFLTLTLFFGSNSFGQITSSISFNNVSAQLMDNGYFFNNCSTSTAGYEIPKGSNKYAIYASAFWFGGHDINSQLKIAAPTYCNAGNDLWAGPLNVNTGQAVIPNPFSQTFWTVTKVAINNHIANYQTPGYVVPIEITNWPAHGDTLLGVDFYLAPFADVNNNGIYEPQLGDYPCIKGDIATFLIMNDAAGVHATGGGIMNIELHFMFYQYMDNQVLMNTTFIDLDLINRGTQTLYDFYTSYFVDADIGNMNDDYFGCDSTRNLMYTYNGDALDEDNNGMLGYGAAPPAIGIVSLSNSVESIGTFSNGVSYPYNDPSNPVEFYNTMKGQWQNGSFWQDNNGNNTHFMYSGNPNNLTEWSENGVPNIPGDRRMVMNNRLGTVTPSDSYSMTYAVVFGQGTDNLSSVTDLFQTTDIIQTFYNQQTQNCFNPLTVNIVELEEVSFNISPNPSTGNFNILFPKEYKEVKVIVKDAYGRVVFSENKQGINKMPIQILEPKGIYFVSIITQDGEKTKKIILN